MAKITFMGAGSSVFAKNILGDAMLSPALTTPTSPSTTSTPADCGNRSAC
jgi:hypothetical protein